MRANPCMALVVTPCTDLLCPTHCHSTAGSEVANDLEILTSAEFELLHYGPTSLSNVEEIRVPLEPSVSERKAQAPSNAPIENFRLDYNWTTHTTSVQLRERPGLTQDLTVVVRSTFRLHAELNHASLPFAGPQKSTAIG